MCLWKIKYCISLNNSGAEYYFYLLEMMAIILQISLEAIILLKIFSQNEVW